MNDPKFLGAIMNGGTIPAKDLVAVTPLLADVVRTKLAIRKLAANTVDISQFTKVQLEGILNSPRIALMHWGYRRAIAMNACYHTFDRDEPWVKEMERDLNHQCMSQLDNHTTFHIFTTIGELYVTFSDCAMWIGSDVKIQQWH